jgi:hypothetical protein
MELEILNYKIINFRLNKRKQLNRKVFDFASSKPVIVHLDVKEEFLSGNTGQATIRLDGPKEVIEMINNGQIVFSKDIYPNQEFHSTIEALLDNYELLKYGIKARNMDTLDLIKNNLIDL